jgi:galactitol-specific phosphotransferase system IIC component
MRNSLIKLLLLNIFIAIVLYCAFAYIAFMSGYASNGNHLREEERMFIGFVIFHFLINFFLLYRYKKFNWIFIFILTALIAIFYFTEAWQFGYLT